MATVADYVILKDDEFEAKSADAEPLSFKLPGGADLSRRTILAFLVRPTGPAKLRLWAAGKELGTHTFASTDIRGIWEVIDGDTLSADLNVIRLIHDGGGNGRLFISDVVLWFQTTV